ncbi:MAG: OmpA family protein [Dechloromonas agitata]|uniref:OmpA family protein n=1 Tax=Dechloromonas agitata TaxID=73030 RepID=A0A930BSN1_9RHOO|nr:OmpA family protein [Dechloromonas agitata]
MPFRPLVLALIALLAGCASAPPPAANPAAATATDAPGRNSAAAERSEKQAMAAIDTGSSVFFSRNSASLDDAGRTVLRQHAERLKANPKQQVTLAGFSDSTGSRTFSLALADKRITSVHNHLRELGVPTRQMRRAVAGVEENSANCQSEECLRLQRRVEIRYMNPR